MEAKGTGIQVLEKLGITEVEVVWDNSGSLAALVGQWLKLSVKLGEWPRSQCVMVIMLHATAWDSKGGSLTAWDSYCTESCTWVGMASPGTGSWERMPTLLPNLSQHVGRWGEKAGFVCWGSRGVMSLGESQLSVKARRWRYGSCEEGEDRDCSAYNETVVFTMERVSNRSAVEKSWGKRSRGQFGYL